MYLKICSAEGCNTLIEQSLFVNPSLLKNFDLRAGSYKVCIKFINLYFKFMD